jgi:hypothetical protein
MLSLTDSLEMEMLDAFVSADRMCCPTSRAALHSVINRWTSLEPLEGLQNLFVSLLVWSLRVPNLQGYAHFLQHGFFRLDNFLYDKY